MTRDTLYELEKRRIGYWQCPNNESHTLEFFPHWQSRYLRCSTCHSDAIFDLSPEKKVQLTMQEDSHDIQG